MSLQQDEIESPYFGQATFSLFTACVHHIRNNGTFIKRPPAMVIENSDHSRKSVLNCIFNIIQEVERHIGLSKTFVN